MSLSFLLSAVVASLVGYALLRGAWADSVPFRPYRAVAAALGIGVGLGVTSVLMFAWLLISGRASRGLVGVELALLALLGIWVCMPGSGRPREGRQAGSGQVSPGEGSPVVTAAFAVAVCCAVAAFLGLSLAQPHGQWDAWMDWNLRARLMFRSGPDWRRAFSGLIPWSHPDYPLLVPASVLRTWVYGGRETLAGPGMIAFLFTFATLALVTSGVAALRSRTQGMIAGVVLLATPFFIFHGVSQYADVPVGFFMLATVVLLALHGRHREQTALFAGLAGFAAGLAAWTKNEGLLFLLAILCSWAVTSLRGRPSRVARRELLAFALGFLPLGVVIALFKLLLAPANDLVTAATAADTLHRLGDPRRYATLAQEFTRHIVSFGFNGLTSGTLLMVLYAICRGIRREELERTSLRWAAGGIGLMVAGHLAVFAVAVDDVPRMVNSSLDRLLLQLWPATLFVWFMIVHTPEEVRQKSARPANSRLAS
jgi:hypothetical protein